MEELEKYSDFVFSAMPVAEMFIIAVGFYWLAVPFMENKKKAFCVGATYLLTMLVLYYMPLHLDRFLAYMIGVLTVFFVMCLTDRRRYEQKLFLTITFFSLCRFACAIAEILYDNLYSLAWDTDYMTARPDMWFVLYILVCIVYLLLEIVLTSISVWFILRTYVFKQANMAKKELFLLLCPSFAGLASYEILYYYRSFYIAETGKNTGFYDMLALLYYAVSAVGIILVIGLYQSIKEKQEERRQNELLAVQIDSIQQHIGQVEELYQNIRSMKHDMANHIFTIERLYTGNQPEEAKAYSKELEIALLEAAGEIKSGNPVTDVILQEKKGEAEKKEIRFYSDFHYPVKSGINVFDISVILNNALQNALEHTEGGKESYISVLSYRRKNAYMIEVKNSFAGKLQWDAGSGLPITSKEKTKGHGYGLANIRKAAGKYAGDIDILLKEREFCLSVLLMAEEETSC